MNVNYDLFERMHKQDGGTPDQQRHYEYGWEACEYAMNEADRENFISCKSGRVSLYRDDGEQGVVLSWVTEDGAVHSTSYSLEDFISFISEEFSKGVPMGRLKNI